VNDQVFKEDIDFEIQFAKLEAQNDEPAVFKLMQNVLAHRNDPVFYIIDEHHELFRP
jgi:hypothetical protein